MSKNYRRIEKERLTIEGFVPIFKQLESLGVLYDRQFCDSGHSYVLHVWINEEVKCNLFMKSLKWVPFGYKDKDDKFHFHKGVSGQGIESLVEYLKNAKPLPKKKEYTYIEKIEALKNILMIIRNETNFDIIDDAIEKYCN